MSMKIKISRSSLHQEEVEEQLVQEYNLELQHQLLQEETSKQWELRGKQLPADS